METLELALCPKEEKHDEDVTKLLEDGVQAMQDDNHLVVARFYSLPLVSEEHLVYFYCFTGN